MTTTTSAPAPFESTVLAEPFTNGNNSDSFKITVEVRNFTGVLEFCDLYISSNTAIRRCGRAKQNMDFLGSKTFLFYLGNSELIYSNSMAYKIVHNSSSDMKIYAIVTDSLGRTSLSNTIYINYSQLGPSS